ncbi:hypothetical protein CMV_002775 [Castanea mollissima]|uniref:DC1 domain-containing protein n=1 Tax=Castanea mollissima TaxID=60419 RepID=A0A8J4W3G0_9ROSI|nr:hypothetical protein CMV_002775 [Castanea mollissima]
MKQLQHFYHPEHPLVFNEERIYGRICFGCREPILGPSYGCKECGVYQHHKSCAELPLGLLHHPLHPLHPLILTYEWADHPEGEKSNCDVCKEKRVEYCYFCYLCNFKLHIKCGSLAPPMEAPEVHHHPLIPLWRWMMFTCDFCGKEDKGMPYLCPPCGFLIQTRCANFPGRLKVIRHNHLLNFIHSLELHQSNSQLCQLCFLKVDTNYGLYYCSRCDFAAHLHCAMSRGNMEDINLLEFKEEESAESKAMLENEDSKLHQSVDSEICKVIKTAVGEDGIEIATEIEHFSHEHHLKLTDEVPNNKICDGLQMCYSTTNRMCALALAACPGLGSLLMGAALALAACPWGCLGLGCLPMRGCLGLGCMPFNAVKGSNGDKALGPNGDSET